MITSLLVGIALLAPNASAGKCDSYLRQAKNTSGSSLIRAFERLATCDSTLAEQNFFAIMTRASDAASLNNLSMAAISNDIWSPLWAMPGKIKSYEARDEVTSAIGAQCSENEKVVTFLQGAYAGIKGIDFQQWDDAFITCESAALNTWLVQQIENPPEKLFDDKFDALVDITVKKMGAEALSHLTAGAIKAAENGPYDKMLNAMRDSVSPNLGTTLTPENQAALETALVQVAQAVSAEKARSVADSLYSSGSVEAAVSLLPAIYSDRVQGSGGFLYGVAAVETGECKGEKSAIVHYAQINESGTRWVLNGEVEEPIRASKVRLKKCTPEDGDWVVRITQEPVSSGSDVGDWADEIAQEWTDKGYASSTRSEKSITLD
jgi:hypothetical protein